METSIPTVVHWLTGKSVFITGVTGYIGKVLLEKLLRCSPGIDKIYIMLRERKGKAIEERLDAMFNLPLFDEIRKTNAESFKKVEIVHGDLNELKVGLSDEHIQRIINVSVIFHVAATVRVDQPLADVVRLNTRGTKEILEIAKQMKQLQAFVHVSTAYTNSDQDIIKEKVYTPLADWRKIIEMAETEEKQLNSMTKQLLGKLPNTYLFSKRLAEQVIHDYRHDVPVLIYRPSMVVSSIREPVPGWVDSLASLTGVLAGTARGLFRVYYGPTDVLYDFIPVDVTVNGMISSAWYRAVRQKSDETVVYNATSEKSNVQEMMDIGFKLLNTHPPADMVWEPYFIPCTNWVLYTILVFFLHLVPGFLTDAILTVTGNKPMVVKIYHLVYTSLNNVYPLMFKNWNFETTNFDTLNDNLLPEDISTYGIERVKDRNEYMVNNYHGMRQYIFKEPKQIQKSSVVRRQRVYWADQIFRLLILGLIIWSLPLSTFFYYIQQIVPFQFVPQQI